MADYDVGVLGLSSPPSSAVVTSYRPAVSVRNNGIHDAIASGYLRIYAAGLLIFETEIYSGTLAPGVTGTADAVDYWTPPAEGTYVIQGYVTTPLDQFEPNNNLSPVTIIVKGGPVPPEPEVPLHAAQHEEGGTDPVNVDGLPGVLADRQPAQPHASQHQAGGDDALNLSGLAGILGEPQTPKVHGNAHHDPAMATQYQLVAHTDSSSAHTAATNLANRDTTGPRTGLISESQLFLSTEPADPGDDPLKAGLRADSQYGPVNPVHHAAKHEQGGLDEISIANLSGKAADAQDPTPHATSHEPGGSDPLPLSPFSDTAGQVLINGGAGEITILESTIPVEALGQNLHIIVGSHLYSLSLSGANTWTFKLYVDGALRGTLSYAQALSLMWLMRLQAHIIAISATHISATLTITGQDQNLLAICRNSYMVGTAALPSNQFIVKLTCECTGSPSSTVMSAMGYAYHPGGLLIP
jgi:hypothetical protein